MPGSTWKKGWLNSTTFPSLFSALTLSAALGEVDLQARAAYFTARVLMDPQTTMSTQMQILKGLTV